MAILLLNGKPYYVSNDPTPEQLQNGIDKGYDAWDRAGTSLLWACAADDVLSAAATIHDEQTLIGGTPFNAQMVRGEFKRNSIILALACDGDIRRDLEWAKAKLFIEVVRLTIKEYWRSEDLNTDITRAQGEAQMKEASQWLNYSAQKLNKVLPYPLDGFPEVLLVAGMVGNLT